MSSNTEKLLEIKNLKAWYSKDRDILKNYSLELNKNEVVGLIGLNGAGKSTFLKVLSGLLESYEADEFLYMEKKIKPRDKSFKTCRYTVFAEDESFQYFTFKEYISYVFSAYKKENVDISELVQGFHFEAYEDKLLKDLSTGNKKKAFLITAFALRPELLLLDEPVNGLDFQSTEYLYELIAGYKKYGTVLFSSHILESITLTSDRVLVLEEGKISRIFEKGQIDATEIREALRYDE